MGRFAAAENLIAEDNPLNQLVASKLSTRAGYSVQIAHNGRQAVEEAVLAQLFDLVLMDDQMPEFSGTEATRKLRHLGLALPVVGLSANAMLSDRKRFLEAGMDGFVGKPFVLDQLCAEIARVLATKSNAGISSAVINAETTLAS